VINEKSKLYLLFKLLIFFTVASVFLAIKNLQNSYNLIHIHSVPDFLVFTALLPKLTGAKVILDMHDLVPEFYLSKFGSVKNSPIFRMLLIIERISAAFADHLIISNHIWFKTVTKRSAKENKCTALINYPDPSVFYKRPRERKNGKYILIYPGSLNWHQGIDVAVKAFALITEQVPNAEFHIYSAEAGPRKTYIYFLIKSYGLTHKIILKNHLPIDQIAGVMANCDLGIVPKRNDSFGTEAFSTKTLEFMSLGVPIIVSRTKIDEYYFDESIVKFFEPGNEQDLAEAIVILLKDNELRETIANNALEFVKENNWNSKKQIYFDIIDSLVGSKKLQT